MVIHNSRKNYLTIIIPNAGIPELMIYRDALLRILSKIVINPSDLELRNNLKAVYDLLNHLQLKQTHTSNGEEKNQPLNQIL